MKGSFQTIFHVFRFLKRNLQHKLFLKNNELQLEDFFKDWILKRLKNWDKTVFAREFFSALKYDEMYCERHVLTISIFFQNLWNPIESSFFRRIHEIFDVKTWIEKAERSIAKSKVDPDKLILKLITICYAYYIEIHAYYKSPLQKCWVVKAVLLFTEPLMMHSNYEIIFIIGVITCYEKHSKRW